MPLTVATLAQFGGVHVGDDDGTGGVLSAVDISNHAGEHLVNHRKWKWLKNRSALIDLRGSVTLTTAVTDTTGQLLTQAGSFANYTHVPGDSIPIASGTGVTTGTVQIVGKVGDDTIALATDINSTSGTASTAGDIAAKLAPNTARLPASFRSLEGIDSILDSNTLIAGLDLITHAHLNKIRTNLISASLYNKYYGALVTGRTPKTTAGGIEYYDAPEWVLEHYPTVSSNTAGVFEMTYNGGWSLVESDNDYIDIPGWLEPCFIQLYKAVALGYLEDDEAPMFQRLGAWAADPMTKAAERRDGAAQPSLGIMTGGGAQRQALGYGQVVYTPWAF